MSRIKAINIKEWKTLLILTPSKNNKRNPFFRIFFQYAKIYWKELIKKFILKKCISALKIVLQNFLTAFLDLLFSLR